MLTVTASMLRGLRSTRMHFLQCIATQRARQCAPINLRLIVRTRLLYGMDAAIANMENVTFGNHLSLEYDNLAEYIDQRPFIAV